MANSLKDKIFGDDDEHDRTVEESAPPDDTPRGEDTGDAPPPDFDTPDTDQSDEDFRAQQKSQAEAQNMYQEGAVPEQRPQAFLQPPTPHSDLTQRLIDEGEINNEPMPASAYSKAASDEQMEASAEASRTPQLHPGLVVKVMEGPHRDRIVAVTRIISYEDDGDLAKVSAGVPEARFVRPKEIEGRAIGDDRDGEILILNVNDANLEVIPNFRSLARR